MKKRSLFIIIDNGLEDHPEDYSVYFIDASGFTLKEVKALIGARNEAVGDHSAYGILAYTHQMWWTGTKPEKLAAWTTPYHISRRDSENTLLISKGLRAKLERRWVQLRRKKKTT